MNNLTVLQAVVIASQLGFVFAASVAIGLFVGSYLDSATNLSPLFTILGALAGTASGMYSCVQLIRFVQRNRGSSR